MINDELAQMVPAFNVCMT